MARRELYIIEKLPILIKKEKAIEYTLPDEITVSPSKTFVLDKRRIKETIKDTMAAQKVLEDIFLEDEDIVNITNATNENKDTITNSIKIDLEPVYYEVLKILSEKEIWKRDEYVSLCNVINVKAEGTLEILNEWSFEKYESLIIEDYGDLHVDTKLIKEIVNG